VVVREATSEECTSEERPADERPAEERPADVPPGLRLGGIPAAPDGSGQHAWRSLFIELVHDRLNVAVFVLVAAAVFFGDSILLPFDYTQRISFANWQYFGTRYVLFDIGFALGMAFVITLQVYSTRAIIRTSRRARQAASEGALLDAVAVRPRGSGPVGLLAALVSLAPSFLCCSPIVPTLIGLLALSPVAQLHTSSSIEYFFATKQNYLLAGSLVLIAASGLWSMRKISRASCMDGACDASSCSPASCEDSGEDLERGDAGVKQEGALA